MTYRVFTQEPFGLSVAEIRRLTDWQLRHLYYLPAVRAARERDRSAGGAGAPPGKGGGGKVQTRAQFVGFHAGQYPNTPLEHWHAQYDVFLQRLGLPPDRPAAGGTADPA